MKNKFETPTKLGMPVIFGMDEEDVIQLYAESCKYCISKEVTRVENMNYYDSRCGNMPYLPYTIEQFNSCKETGNFTRLLTDPVNRKRSIRGIKKRYKKIQMLSADLIKICQKTYGNEDHECRAKAIKRFSIMCKIYYLSYPPRSISIKAFQTLLVSPHLSAKEINTLKSIYILAENNVYSAKNRIDKKNYIQVRDLINKGRGIK